jgi:hypothetical protein
MKYALTCGMLSYGDTSKGEWTTTITFSANTNKMIRIDRDRR